MMQKHGNTQVRESTFRPEAALAMNSLTDHADSLSGRWVARILATSLGAAVLLVFVGAGVPSTTSAREYAGQTFELRVVGPDGKAIANAKVDLRATPAPAAEQIRQGKFLKKGPNATSVETDAAGQLVVDLPQIVDDFNVYITTPGYGPYWAGWSSSSHAQPIPRRFTAELESAWSVGGIIVDESGKPAEGVNVTPSVEFKKRPGETQQLAFGTRLKTDAVGKWRFDSVPVSMSEVYVSIDHENFKPIHRSLPRGVYGFEHGHEPAVRIVLERGLTVLGKVADEAGKPIAGARRAHQARQ